MVIGALGSRVLRGFYMSVYRRRHGERYVTGCCAVGSPCAPLDRREGVTARTLLRTRSGLHE